MGSLKMARIRVLQQAQALYLRQNAVVGFQRQYGLSPATVTALPRRSLNTTVSLLQEKDTTTAVPSDPVEAIPVEKRKHITEEIAKHNETKSKLAAEETSHDTTKNELAEEVNKHLATQEKLNETEASHAAIIDILEQEKNSHITTKNEL